MDETKNGRLLLSHGQYLNSDFRQDIGGLYSTNTTELEAICITDNNVDYLRPFE